MKQMICEMCGSTELVKQDGFFVCQTCGTKYSVEEAKKMMIEGTVNIQGEVKINRQEEYENYISIAKQNLEFGTWQTGYDACEKALSISPKSCEAWTLKAQYLNRHGNKPGEWVVSAFKSAAEHANASEIKYIYKTVEDILQKEINDTGMYRSTYTYGTLQFDKWCSFITNISGFSPEEKNHLYSTKILVWYKNIYLPEIESRNGSLDVYAAKCKLASTAVGKDTTVNEIWWKNRNVCIYLNELNTNNGIPDKYDVYEPNPNVTVNTTQKSGCYVATCVYGSYDCPQVWTLRRYRDDTLGSTWYGRLFIRTYYAISPTLVKWFGKTNWFKKLWKGKLDRMVAKLQSKGVEDTPYEDKNW